MAGQPAADILRKLIILGGRSGSSELRDWASQELRGYKEAASVPDYRRVWALIQMDAFVGNSQIKRQTIDPWSFPEEVRDDISNEVKFAQGIGEIQSMIDTRGDATTIRVALPGQTYIASLIDEASGNPYQHVTDIYWNVSVTALEGIVDQVKTRLAELLGELRAATSPNQEVPTHDQAAHAVNVVINGKGNNVQLAHAGQGATTFVDQGGGSEQKEGPFWTLGKRIGAVTVGAATILATLIAWWQSQGAV